MKTTFSTRRMLIGMSAAALAGAVVPADVAVAQSRATRSSITEDIVRRWYKAWSQKEWAPLDRLLADDFTFTSANDDDHISKSTFKSRCWETQKDFIDHFDLEQLVAKGNEAFVKYLCYTANGRSFRNVEFIQIREGQLESIECYFGGRSTFPSAVSAKEAMA